jgi:replication initiation protein RepC
LSKNISCSDEPEFVNYKSTTQKQTNNKTIEVLDSSESENRNGLSDEVVANLEHISLAMVLGVSSKEFRAKIPITGKPLTWLDLITVAYHLKTDLGISQKCWGYACQLLGRKGAAIALILADTKQHQERDPVRNPAAYFNGMLEKARHNELNLLSSVFGLLERR